MNTKFGIFLLLSFVKQGFGGGNYDDIKSKIRCLLVIDTKESTKPIAEGFDGPVSIGNTGEKIDVMFSKNELVVKSADGKKSPVKDNSNLEREVEQKTYIEIQRLSKGPKTEVALSNFVLADKHCNSVIDAGFKGLYATFRKKFAIPEEKGTGKSSSAASKPSKASKPVTSKKRKL